MPVGLIGDVVHGLSSDWDMLDAIFINRDFPNDQGLARLPHRAAMALCAGRPLTSRAILFGLGSWRGSLLYR